MAQCQAFLPLLRVVWIDFLVTALRLKSNVAAGSGLESHISPYADLGEFPEDCVRRHSLGNHVQRLTSQALGYLFVGQVMDVCDTAASGAFVRD